MNFKNIVNPVVIVHADCHDGVTAAWVARHRWPDCPVVFAHHSDPFEPTVYGGRDVVMIDFCLEDAMLSRLSRIARSILVLDHHKTTFETRDSLIDYPESWLPISSGPPASSLPGARYLTFVLDLNRSGAGLAWDELVGGERPQIVNYVEDRDLWRFALQHSREVHAACDCYPLTLEARNELVKRSMAPAGIQSLADEGRIVLRYHDKLVAEACKEAREEMIGGVVVPSLACPNPQLVSDIGQRLAEGKPFAAVWCLRPDGKRRVSLRSRPGGMDVSEVAKKYPNGGGHRHAASFTDTPRMSLHTGQKSDQIGDSDINKVLMPHNILRSVTAASPVEEDDAIDVVAAEAAKAVVAAILPREPDARFNDPPEKDSRRPKRPRQH